MQVVLLDTGPLVASLDASDAWHQPTLAALETIREPLITCEAVLAETCFLLRHHKPAMRMIDRWLEEGTIRVAFSLAEHHHRVFSIIGKYADLPASLADACLVVMSELYPEARVFTLDHHFKVYRRLGRRIIPTVEI